MAIVTPSGIDLLQAAWQDQIVTQIIPVVEDETLKMVLNAMEQRPIIRECQRLSHPVPEAIAIQRRQDRRRQGLLYGRHSAEYITRWEPGKYITVAELEKRLQP